MIKFITKYILIPKSRVYDKSLWGTKQPLNKLAKTSGVSVQVECEDCGIINNICYADLKNRKYYRCHKCAMKRKRGISNKKNIGNIPWNKNKKDFLSKESKQSMIKKLKGRKIWNKGTKGLQKAWNKGKKGMWNEDQLRNNSIKNSYHLKDYQEKYPLFYQIEELKEEDWVLFGRCKNSNCVNSKEKNGWFELTKGQIHGRLASIYHNDGAQYWYCSEECKQECPTFKKTSTQLINDDKRKAGLVKKGLYTNAEYQLFRQIVFDRENNICEYCGEKASIVHHILPQKMNPENVLDPDYGIACCTQCHYKYGHRDSWCTTGYIASLICNVDT